MIILVAVGGAVLLCCAALIVFFLCRKRRRDKGGASEKLDGGSETVHVDFGTKTTMSDTKYQSCHIFPAVRPLTDFGPATKPDGKQLLPHIMVWPLTAHTPTRGCKPRRRLC